MVARVSATTSRWCRSTPAARAAAVAVIAAGLLAGCGGGGGQNPSPSPNGSPRDSLAARGKELADARCQSCHSVDGSSGVGPTWKGLAGSRVKLADGKTVTADDAYLRTAIEKPDDQIVAGYQRGVMSSAVPPGSISTADARALIAYIKTLR